VPHLDLKSEPVDREIDPTLALPVASLPSTCESREVLMILTAIAIGALSVACSLPFADAKSGNINMEANPTIPATEINTAPERCLSGMLQTPPALEMTNSSKWKYGQVKRD
jgi:hypothetical protein